MKIFITGESGVIPLEIQKMNSQYGHDIVNTQLWETPIDYLKSYKSFQIRKPEIDFTNEKILRAAIELTQPDCIIHSGAFVGTDYCDEHKDFAVVNNVYGTKLIVDICNEKNISLIYFSTTAIYDPSDYSRTKPITENTRINPQTLYGITKYAGELIVRNECKTKRMIIRPVFGFGNYPNDLHSALTKIIYTCYAEERNNLDILLNPRIAKSYWRVENIARCVLELIKRDCWGEEVNVGENYTERKDLIALLQIIKSSANAYHLDDKLTVGEIDKIKEEINYRMDNCLRFFAVNDYLHWHNIDNKKLRLLIGDVDTEKFVSLFSGIAWTIASVFENQTIKPYWL